MNILESLSFTKKYLFALSLIALFSILGYLNLTHLITSQADDAKLINISGKQRMLSQKISLFAITYKEKQLKETINLMDKSHKDLLSKPMSKAIYTLYFSEPSMLDEKVRMYIKSANSFVNIRDGKSLTYLLSNSQKLLKNLDNAVSIYQNEAEERIKKLQTNELYIILLTLFTLMLEALFIFRPANNKINMKTNELKAQKEFENMITQTNTNAIIAVNDKFEILIFNKSAEKMFGYDAGEMMYTHLTDDRIIPTEFLQQHNNGLANFMKSGKLKYKGMTFELEAQKKDKTIFPIRISFGAKISKNEKIIVANIQDITNEKDKDNLIIQQSRYAAMGEMIGNIAHQWRQPLSSISALATGANIRYKNNLISDKELDATFVKIKDHTKHLSQTIDDFRDFFKNDKTNELFDITDVVKKSVSLIEASYIEHNIKLIIEKEECELLVSGSSSQLSQVILNILNNAKEALVEKEIENKIVYLEILKDDDYVVLNISDNAGGIADNISAKIYEPYFTTKHKAQGTGIGLFMSKRIVEELFNSTLSNENIEFEVGNEKHFGVSFSIRIKLVL